MLTKQEMKKLIADSINPPKICRVYFKYDSYYYYFFPIKFNDMLFLGMEEDDFILDGYSIRRFRDATKIEIKDDKCLEINIREGNIKKLTVPDVDISNWETVFTSLKKIDKKVIVENENVDEEKSEFAIGQIVSVHKKFIYLRYFDADGIWENDLYKIYYSSITSVTFGSRYVDIFSKYLSSAPENKNK